MHEYFRNFHDFDLLHRLQSFLVAVNEEFKITEINDNIHQITAYPKSYYIGKPINLLLESEAPLILKKNSGPKEIRMIHCKLKVSPKATLPEIGDTVAFQESSLARLHANVTPFPQKTGTLLLVHIIPFYVENLYRRLMYVDMFLILDETDRIVDYNENFFLRFHRIWDARSLTGRPIKDVIQNKDWDRLTGGRAARIRAMERACRREITDWHLEYGGQGLDFSKDWLYDKTIDHHPTGKSVRCASAETFAYFILNKPLPLSLDEFKIEFRAQTQGNPSLFCFLFGHNEVENYAPDIRGYLVGVAQNQLFLKRKARTIVQTPVEHGSGKEPVHYSLIYRNGAIRFFINGRKVLEYLDPFPITPAENSRYCGLAFSVPTVFSDFSLHSHASLEKHPLPAEDETFIRLRPLPNQIYHAELTHGIFGTRSTIFLHLSEVTHQEVLEQLKANAKKALEEAQMLHQENIRLTEMNLGLSELVGESPDMLKIKSLLRQISDSQASVFILGETGTGKDLVALQIHKLSERRGPFIKVDCAAIPSALLESELFGYEKGAFTGAYQRHLGRIEKAQGGTLFLDEIGNLNLNAQAKLLRVINDREFERVGGEASIKVDVRIVAATNADIHDMVDRGTFRKDLFFRLNVIGIHMPALDHRRDDIPSLVRYYLHKKSKEKEWQADKKLMDWLERRPWPGNVRELFNLLDYAIAVSKTETLVLEDFPPDLVDRYRTGSPGIPGAKEPPQDEVTSAWSLSGGDRILARAFLDKSESEFQTLFSERRFETPQMPRPTACCRGLNERHFRILGLIYRNTPLTLRELGPLFDVTRLTLQRDLARLIETGLVRREGKARAVKFIWTGK